MYKQTSVLTVLFLSILPQFGAGLQNDCLGWRWTLANASVRRKGPGLLALVLGSVKGRGFCVLITVSCSSLCHPLSKAPPHPLIIRGEQLGLPSGTCLALVLAGEWWMSLI
jgi:hypothetical protein